MKHLLTIKYTNLAEMKAEKDQKEKEEQQQKQDFDSLIQQNNYLMGVITDAQLSQVQNEKIIKQQSETIDMLSGLITATQLKEMNEP